MRWSVIRRKLARVDRAIDKAIEGAEIPGAVVLARMPREGEIIEHVSVRGHAVVRPERIAMTRETIFDLASLTKPLATTSALSWLVHEGRVDLDAPVAKYLPAFAERDKEAVTVRHLLTHSSGLKPWRAFHEVLLERERKTGERWLATPAGRELVIDRIVRSALVHAPGEAAVYGDLDFITLGALVEAVTHQRLDDFCRERVFDPIGMRDTFFLPLGEGAEIGEPLRRRIAATENCPWREKIVWGEVHDPNAWAMGGVAGHAGLFSTADDVMRFALAVLDAWHGRGALLPPAQVRAFSERQELPKGSDWALGWDTPTAGQSSSGRYFSARSIGHLGFTGTSLWIDLEREAVVVMLTNRVHQVAKKSRFELRPIVHDLVIEGMLAEDAPRARAKAAKSGESAPMSEAPRRVHFVAIGGTGVGSLAGLLHARGLVVTGSDDHLYPPMSTLLAGWGIAVQQGFSPEHALSAEPDLVVIGNAVRPDNPEARAVIEAGIPYRSFSDALYELAIAGKHSVVITGTHGKTTTTSLVASLLLRTGRDPSLLVGGHALDFDGSFREGRGEHFVVEGDEYDTAFFDKTPKFLHYHPRTLVVTSVEFDHADIYRDLEHVKDAFRTLVAQMPRDGTIVAALGHEGVRDVVRDAPCRVVGYGIGDDPDFAYAASELAPDEAGTRFALLYPGGGPLAVRMPMHGRHNVENALAAIATAAELGVPIADAASALEPFQGVRRRLEVRGEAGGVTVLDDFAHHPTAVEGTLEAVRARYPGRRVIAIFEPRTNTSRRKVFQEQYARSFDRADHVVIRIVPDTPIYSATGEVTERFSADALAADLAARGLSAVALPDVDAIVAHVTEFARPGDVAVVMSNGDFGGVWEKLLAALGARGAALRLL